MTVPIASGGLERAAAPREGGPQPIAFRYGLVFAVTLTLVVFQIVAPSGAWSRAVAVGLELLALTIVVATSRELASVRRARALAVAAVGVTLLVLIALADVGPEPSFLIGGLLALLIPGALVGGVIRLIRERGVTLHAISGALTIYLYVGLLFAWAIGFVGAVSDEPFFAQPNVGPGDRVYYSFTVLTTTGFGDYTAATQVGHALAVVEMLIGQLYLVTVIGVLVGHLVGARREQG